MKNRQLIDKNLPDKDKYTEDLFMSISIAFEPLKILFHSLYETEKHSDIAIMGEAMFERAETSLAEMHEMVKEHIGKIELTRACCRNSNSIAVRTLLSAKVD